jgi:2-haloacid dehalogenase
MTRTKPAIIFDFGGVLIDWNPRHLYRRLFENAEEMESFFTEVGLSAWNEQQDAGRPFAEAVALLTAQHPHRTELIRAFWERWEETVAGAIEPTVQILKKLKARNHTLAGLSNWSAETFPRVRHQFEFFDLLDVIVLSGEEKVSKPDARIFQILLKRINHPAGECLFIDDSVKNTEAAQHLGFQVIHFQSPAQLDEKLSQMNILA